MTSEWSGRRVTQARAIVATWLPAPCGQCTRTVTTTDEWVVGHKIARSLRPDLTWHLANWQPEHRACSNRTGQAAVIAKARAEGARSAGGRPFFPAADTPGSLRHFLSLPPGPLGGPKAPIDVRSDLLWSPDALRERPWTAEFAEVPADASPPLWMSPVPPDAVCSYAWSGCTHQPLQPEPRPSPWFVGPMPAAPVADAVSWIQTAEGKVLRWWQRLATVRQLEHRADGSLCWSDVLESGPRRIGKSVRIRGLALWRLAVGPLLFGERQVVVHTGSDVAICRAVQKAAWPWARQEWSTAGHKPVTVANGKEAVTTPAGDEWLVRSQSGVYGYDVTLALVDEGWNVEPVTVTEGLEPSTMERRSAQNHLTSTAHRLATSLMRNKLSTALAYDDGQTLVLVWAAAFGADSTDPATWKAASPHWSGDRERMVSTKLRAAQAGEADPETDDPDPMAGWEAQYLNRWRLSERRQVGDQAVNEEVWASLAVLPEDRGPDAVAVEGWFADGVTVTRGWRDGGAVIVSATDYPDLAEAVAAVKALGYRGLVNVGASLAEDPLLRGVRVAPASIRSAAAAAETTRLVAEGVVRHDGGQHLTGQVLAMRTQDGFDGPRLVSKGRADAVKAAVWVVTAARSKRSFMGVVAGSATGR